MHTSYQLLFQTCHSYKADANRGPSLLLHLQASHHLSYNHNVYEDQQVGQHSTLYFPCFLEANKCWWFSTEHSTFSVV